MTVTEEAALRARLIEDFDRALDLVGIWRRRAEAAEQERDAAYSRIDTLANECQPHLVEIASLKEQLDRALHALSLTGRTQSAARA